MASFLLDSCVIIDVITDRKNRRQFVRELVAQGNVLACCAINVTEVYAGMRPAEEPPTRQFLESLEYYPISSQTAQMAGLLKYEYRKKGITLSTTDVTIAAVAIQNRVPLLTDNVKHFPMKEVVLYPLPKGVRGVG